MPASQGQLAVNAGPEPLVEPNPPARSDMREVSGRAHWDEWSEAIRPRLVRLAWRFLGDGHAAEEVAQEALLLAWREHGRMPEAPKRNAWVWRTTINTSLNRLRRRHEQPLPPGREPAPDDRGVSRNQEVGELAERARQVISELPDRQRAAFVLRELERLEYVEVAAILQTHPSAVRLLVHRARETLRQTLLRRWPDSFGQEP